MTQLKAQASLLLQPPMRVQLKTPLLSLTMVTATQI